MRSHLALALLLLTAACSSKSDPGADVPAQCHGVEDTICQANQTCSVAAGETTQAQAGSYIANCKGGFSTTLNCEAKHTLGGDPAVCERDVVAMPCDLYVVPTGLPIPASCKGLFP